MKKQFNYCKDIIKKEGTKKLSIVGCVSEQLIRRYVRGLNVPQLKTAVLLEKELNIPCEFWVINKKDNS